MRTKSANPNIHALPLYRATMRSAGPNHQPMIQSSMSASKHRMLPPRVRSARGIRTVFRSVLADGRGQGALDGPAQAQAGQDISGWNADLASPLGHGMSCIAKGQMPILSRIIGLDDRQCPSAVSLFVVPIEVDAINRTMWRWTAAHVGKEIGERITPAVTNGNASCAVDSIALVSRIGATIAEMEPCLVFRRASHSMRRELRTSTFAMNAATTSSIAGLQIAQGHDSYSSARTAALPFGRMIGDIAFDGQPAVDAAREIEAPTHRPHSIRWRRVIRS
jgi:hypothetical protein